MANRMELKLSCNPMMMMKMAVVAMMMMMMMMISDEYSGDGLWSIKYALPLDR